MKPTQSPLSDRADRRISVMMLSSEYPPESPGGIGTHVSELATGLSRMGCDITVLAYTPRSPAVLRESNLAVHRIASDPATRSDASERAIVRGVLAFNDALAAYGRALLDEGLRPDLIHSHEWFLFPAARELGRMAGIPVVSTLHMLEQPIRRWWGETPAEECIQLEKALCDESDKLIAVSRSLASITKATHGVPDHRIEVIYNGLDAGPFMSAAHAPETLRALRRTIASAEEKIVLFAGRLHPQKGIAALLASAAQVAEERSNVRYLLAGEPSTRDSARMVQELLQLYAPLRKRVKMLGKLPRKQLATLYQIADSAIMPSIYEPFGWVAIEAMSAGVPVIATDVGGFAEIIQHDQTGLLIPVHAREPGPHAVDVEELTAAQLRLIDDESLARRLGAAGRQRVMNQFGSETMAQATLQLYRRTL